MRTIVLAMVVWALTAAVSYGQHPALTKGSAGAYRAIADSQRRAAIAAENWRSSKKLSVLDKLPKSPRGQGECISVKNLDSNSVGYLEYWHFEVLQVVGPRDLILMMRNPDIPPIWLTGYSTGGLVDGDKVRLVGLVEVVGTKKYTTIEGSSRTVRMIRLVSQKRTAELEAMAAAKEERERAEAASLAWKAWWDCEKQTWTDKSGKYSIEAIYDGYLGEGKIRLQRKDQSEIILHLSKLSNPDRLKALALRRAAEKAKEEALRQNKKKEDGTRREGP